MKRCIGIVLLLALVFALSVNAETAWECVVCHRRVQASLGDTCPYCGATRHVHTWQDATCTKPKTCTGCGATEGEAPGHQWDEGTVVQAATCQTMGIKSYTCTVCGTTRDERIPKDMGNHTGGTEIKDRSDATCAADGYTGDTYCKSCGGLIRKGNAIPATGHQWDQGTVLSEATCQMVGAKRYMCTICGATRLEEIPEDPANHVGGTEIKGKLDATCTTDGYTGDTYCKGCGRLIRKGNAIPAAGHQWNQGAVLSEATCQMIGAKSYTCTICGTTRLEEIPKDSANHAGETEIRGKLDATCTTDGYTGDTYCKGCGELINKGNAIPALGHSWQEATCTQPKACSRCGTTEGTALGHSWQDATYTAPKTCARCGATEGEPLEMPVKVGDVITFGHYPQTASGTDSTPIEWIILDRDGNRALLLSKYGLDAKPYNNDFIGITWEQCSLRKWLNGEFLNQAFSSEEQAKIAETTINNPVNPEWGTDGGNATADRVFLLSIDEANRYFKTDDDRTAKLTPYAVKKGAAVVTAEDIGKHDYFLPKHVGNCYWWLRSPGNEHLAAAYVSSIGVVLNFGYAVSNDDFAVRPAFWLNLES